MFKIKKPMAKKYIALAVNAFRRIAMKPVKGKIFEGQMVIMDFARYEDCDFINCRMVYIGIGGFYADSCNFYGGSWEFDGPAGNSLCLMKLINQTSPELIDLTFGIQRKNP